jgi:hypothetical protein
MTLTNLKTKVINLFGGPSDGKSTTAAGLFHYFKVRGHNVEMAMEYPKELVWAGHFNDMSDQLGILAEQNRRIRRLYGKVEYVIAECPMLMGITYKTKDYPDSFDQYCYDIWNSYRNINILIKRNRPYSPIGRRQSEASALEQRNKIIGMMQKYKISAPEILSDALAPSIIYGYVTAAPGARKNIRTAQGKVAPVEWMVNVPKT